MVPQLGRGKKIRIARLHVGRLDGWNCVSISSLNNLVNHFPSQLCQPLISTEMASCLVPQAFG